MNGFARMREEAGFTQQELANALQVDRSTIAKWETGSAYPTGKKIPLVAKILGCKIEELYSDGHGTQASNSNL